MDNLFSATASNLVNIQETMAGLMQSDFDNDAMPGQGAFASFIAPIDVTPQVMSQIKALPVAKPHGEGSSGSDIWLVHTVAEQEHEGSSYTCTVHQVTKENGSNGAVLPESDGLGMKLAMSGVLDPSNDMSKRPPILLGTIAKACLKPGSAGGNMNMTGMFPPAAAAAFDIRPSRPRKVLFQTRGELAMIAPDLQSMGITEFDVAERALIRSMELYSSTMNDLVNTPRAEPDVFGGPVGLANSLMTHAEAFGNPYVSEETIPLGRWRPPNGADDLPAKWFARPPEDRHSYRPTALLGWRTNLERAILREDIPNVKAIVGRYDSADIREFVECRLLLTKCAQRGLVDACTVLIEECGASVEGVQAPDRKSWWHDVQNGSGNFGDLTPLHQACRNGQEEAARLLLDHGADVNKIDQSRVSGSALHHAVSTGEIDCCRLVCERGASHTYHGLGGEALDISEQVAQGDLYRNRVQKEIQKILREFDTRCSNCQHPNPLKSCPCKKERYCNATCQKSRWKNHKKYHKEIVGQSK